jgi:hypothetical protein
MPKRPTRSPFQVARLLTELVEQAKKVSPSKHMTVYIGDLEAILYLDAEPTPSKVGQNEGTVGG